MAMTSIVASGLRWDAGGGSVCLISTRYESVIVSVNWCLCCWSANTVWSGEASLNLVVSDLLTETPPAYNSNLALTSLD